MRIGLGLRVGGGGWGNTGMGFVSCRAPPVSLATRPALAAFENAGCRLSARGRRDGVEVVILQCLFVLWALEEFGYRVLSNITHHQHAFSLS